MNTPLFPQPSSPRVASGRCSVKGQVKSQLGLGVYPEKGTTESPQKEMSQAREGRVSSRRHASIHLSIMPCQGLAGESTTQLRTQRSLPSQVHPDLLTSLPAFRPQVLRTLAAAIFLRKSQAHRSWKKPLSGDRGRGLTRLFGGQCGAQERASHPAANQRAGRDGTGRGGEIRVGVGRLRAEAEGGGAG